MKTTAIFTLTVLAPLFTGTAHAVPYDRLAVCHFSRVENAAAYTAQKEAAKLSRAQFIVSVAMAGIPSAEFGTQPASRTGDLHERFRVIDPDNIFSTKEIKLSHVEDMWPSKVNVEMQESGGWTRFITIADASLTKDTANAALGRVQYPSHIDPTHFFLGTCRFKTGPIGSFAPAPGKTVPSPVR